MQTKINSLAQTAPLFAPAEGSIRILVACDERDYSASALARAIEDCDARLLGLTLSSPTDDTGAPLPGIIAHLLIDRGSVHPVCRSLERYGFEIVATSADHDPENPTDNTDADDDADADGTMRSRANFVLRCLNI